MFRGKFIDIVLENDGFLRGPFGSALKKSLFVPKSIDTYKVYEQSVVLEKNKYLGDYYISKEYFESNMKNFEIKSGDFLVSCSGVNYGEIYELEGVIEKGIINQALLRIRINEKIVDRNYFLYYFRAYIAKVITGGTGDSTIPNFPPMNFVKNVQIELPNIEIQRKIGKILKKIDEKITFNNQINNNLDYKVA
jgi:type I restriction enzyme S subunit